MSLSFSLLNHYIIKGDVALRINTIIYCNVNQDLNNFKILKISNSFYLKLNI